MTTLYPYQEEGVAAIQAFGGRVLLGDDMGLGKSAQSIIWRKRHYKLLKPTVVVCQASLKWKWESEWKKFANMHVEILNSTRVPTHLPRKPAAVYIINYDILFKRANQAYSWTKWLKALDPGLIIIDECHELGNPASRRSKAVRWLCSEADHVLGLSGTPITSRPFQLYTMLSIIAPGEFGTPFEFGTRYCGASLEFGKWNYRGASNLKELNRRLRETCLIRRRKADVLKDLPPITTTVVPVDIAKRREYDKAESEFKGWVRRYNPRTASKEERADALARTTRLRTMVAELKEPAVIRWIEDYFHATDGKLLTFGVHYKMMRPVYKKFRDQAVGVDGTIIGKKRQFAFDRFNTDKDIRLFVGQIKAAGTGWDCTATSDVAFLELDWIPGHHTQAVARAHGVGRGKTGHPTFAHYLVAKGTIEEQVMRVLQRKQDVLDKTLDGVVSGQMEFFNEVLAEMRKC